MKEKSYNDVMRQLDNIREQYNGSEHYSRALDIAVYYMARLDGYAEDMEEKLGYEYRSFVPDTDRAIIKSLEPRKIDGLWFDYNGKKLTPHNLYFGCDTRLIHFNGGETCGKCFTHYDNALRPVYLANGERFIWYPLANVNCYYKNGMLYDFHRQ